MIKEKKVAKSIKTKKRASKKPQEKETSFREDKKENEEALLVSQLKQEESEYLAEGEKDKKSKRYYETVGRRKTAMARVRLLTIKPFEGDEGKITVNGKFYKDYFSTLSLQQMAEASLRRLKSLNRFEVMAKVKGGGVKAQAEALRHGLARALVLFNVDFRKKLKKAGFMRRDPRMKERRKYGLKKARRAPQWAKR